MKHRSILSVAVSLLLVLCLLTGCGIREKIVDFLVSLDPVQTEKGTAPSPDTLDHLSERIPMTVEGLDLHRGTAEECYGYITYLLSGLRRSEVMAYVEALSTVEGLTEVENWEIGGDVPSYYCLWRCVEHRQSLQICFLNDTMVLMVGDSWYLPPAGNGFVQAGLEKEKLGELAYNANENEILDTEGASPLMLDHHQIRIYEATSFEAVFNLVFKLREAGYRDSVWPGAAGECDNPTELDRRICERMSWGKKELVVLYVDGRAMLVEGEAGITMTEEALWEQLGGAAAGCLPGISALVSRMEALEYYPMVEEDRSGIFSFRGGVTEEDYRARIQLLSEAGYNIVVLDEEAADGFKDYIAFKTDSYAGLPCHIFVGLSLDEKGELEIRMATTQEAVCRIKPEMTDTADASDGTTEPADEA